LSEWHAAAHRREVDLDVLTQLRSAAEGYTLRGGARLIAIVHPFEGESISVGFADLGRVAAWVEEMRPRQLRVLGIDDADAAALRDAVADYGRSGGGPMN
jgi:hypothetical protein